jgi:hypothetical protein
MFGRMAVMYSYAFKAQDAVSVLPDDADLFVRYSPMTEWAQEDEIGRAVISTQ